MTPKEMPIKSHKQLLRCVNAWLASPKLCPPLEVPRRVRYMPMGDMSLNAHKAAVMNGAAPGEPDFYTWWPGGRFLGVEVKHAGDGISPEQKAAFDTLASLGHSVLVLWSSGRFRFFASVALTPLEGSAIGPVGRVADASACRFGLQTAIAHWCDQQSV